MIRWVAWTAGTLAAAVLWAVTAMAHQAPQTPKEDRARAPQQVSELKETLANLGPSDRIDAGRRSS